MRILTIGAKRAVNEALARHAAAEIVALVGDDEQRILPCPTLPYGIGSKLHWSSVRQVRNAVRATEPDVVHAFYPRPLAHAVLASLSLGSRAPIVSYRGVTSIPKRRNPDEWITYLSPRVRAHACESEAVAAALVSGGVQRAACHVVHNCLTDVPQQLSRDQARHELRIPAKAFVVMTVANMRRVKGADLLLRAAGACGDLPALHVALVGRVLDDEVQRLAASPQLAGRVTLAGYRADARRLLSAADLFVMPSRAEALSVALLEAMAAGVCPVVSTAGGMKEAVRHEIDGLVFPSEDVDALTAAIRRLHHQRELLSGYRRSAQQRAETHFSATAMADRLVGVYRDVLSDSPGRTAAA